MLLYIIRHGIPDYETDSLTELGKKQAEAVAKRLAVHGIDEIYSSPMGRARQTAEPTAKLLGKEIKIIDTFSENFAASHFNYYDEEGFHWAYDKPQRILYDDSLYHSPDSFSHGIYADDEYAREGYKELCAASDSFLKSLGYKRTGKGNAYLAENPNDKKIALFCHHGAGLHIMSRLLNLPPHIFTATFDISHTGVCIIAFNGSGEVYPRALCISDMSHIYESGLPFKYNDSLDI